MYLNEEEPDGWEETLQQYSEFSAHKYKFVSLNNSDRNHLVQAFRDYEYMAAVISNGTEDPFVATSGDKVVLWMLEQIHQKQKDTWPQSQGKSRLVSEEKWKRICDDEEIINKDKQNEPAPPIGGTRRATAEYSQLRSFHGRLLMAVVGAIFLIGPMWLMVLHNTHYTALVSTSVLVVFFGVFMARYLEQPMDVLSSTAAYAAVLIVFVGTNSGGNST
jgi:hypothetical protein